MAWEEYDYLLAGWLLIFITSASMLVYTLLMRALKQLGDENQPTFFVLLSSTVADFVFFGQYFLLGVAIVGQRHFRFTDVLSARVSSVLFCCGWHPVIFHYVLVAYNRYCAVVRFQHFSSIFNRRRSIGLSCFVWVAATLVTLVTHWPSLYPEEAFLHYRPEMLGYGPKNLTVFLQSGISNLWTVINASGVVLSTPVYLCLIGYLAVKQQTSQSTGLQHRLLVICIFNNLLFILANVYIVFGYFETKWQIYSMNLLVVCNSATNGALLLFFSAPVRTKVLAMIGWKTKVKPVGTSRTRLAVPKTEQPRVIAVEEMQMAQPPGQVGASQNGDALST